MTLSKPIESVAERSVDDISLVAYLSCVGFKHARMERNDDGDCIWVFQDSVSLNETLLRYAAGEASVSPQWFSREFGRVRQAMFNFLDSFN